MTAQAQPSANQPNQRVLLPRPNAPPHGSYDITADTQENEGSLRHLRGKAKIETDTMLLQADSIDYDDESGDLRANGNVYFHSFAQNEQLWADRVVYNTDSETGTFYNVRGTGYTRIDARPGRLTTSEPFFFQGQWAERVEDHYILHNGFITNCKMPNPWWELKGRRFTIYPGDHAIAYGSIFWVKKLPIFYAPYFYKSLEKFPRRSGFLFPNIGNSTNRGFMLGMGYFWAINRSYDMLYHMTEYTARGEAHHLELRGNPKEGTDFDAIIYGVDDRLGGQGPVGIQQYSGYTITGTGRADLGNGWSAHGSVNYTSSFAFRQDWSESINEAVGQEVHSTGYVNKNWSNYNLDIAAVRLEDFQSVELPVENTTTGKTPTQTDAAIIRKLPEVDFSGREQQIGNLPLWYSFDSSAGMLYREEPLYSQFGVGTFTPNANFPGAVTLLADQFQTSPVTGRVNFAPNLMTAFHWHGFDLVPRFGIQETYYSQSQLPDPNASQLFSQPSTQCGTVSCTIYQVNGAGLVRSSRAFSLDLAFPSFARVFDKKTRFGDKLKHVIEPRATYQYVTGIGQDFNRYIRFDGMDLLANTNELDLSLTNRIYAKRGNDTQEIFTWELAQARYFDPTFGGALVPGQRNIFLAAQEISPYAFLLYPRSASPIDSSLRATPIGGITFDWRADYDPLYRRMTNSTVALDLRWKRYYFVSLGDNLVHTNPILSRQENQIHARAGYGDITRRGFNFGVDTIYDTHYHNLDYLTAQATYNTNCCGFSFQYRVSDFAGFVFTQYRVSFAVSNLGSFGTLRKQDRIF
ncbi:MAG TPA: LPS assembly protein LptD [Bryobacteraceae bacterium]|nr:LPS assembly protein LptD [Bryobacteraceae bacterium]